MESDCALSSGWADIPNACLSISNGIFQTCGIEMHLKGEMASILFFPSTGCRSMALFIKALSFIEVHFSIWVVAAIIVLKPAVGALEYAAVISSGVDGPGVYRVDGERPDVSFF